METWPLWECLRPESLIALAALQWKLYGTRLDLLSDPYKELESVEEIGRLIRKPPKYRVV